MSTATKRSIQAWNRCISLPQRSTTPRHLKSTHALFIVHSLHHNNYAISKLLDAFCAISNCLSHASMIFNHIETPNSYIYNTLIRAYARSSSPPRALHYFTLMLDKAELEPDNHTFHFVLVACANTRLVDYASKALSVFNSMLGSGFEFDEFCVTTALTACANLGSFSQGKWIHEYVKRRKGFEFDVFVGTALVDMYGKCGCIDMAVEAFEKLPKRNLFSWAAMIRAFAIHGFARSAINCLERMQVDDGLKPDGVVLLGVLMACTHAGLLEEGKHFLTNMEEKYRVAPKHEHYSCVVDLLCRTGRLNEALELIRSMPMKPLASVWGALLNSCRTHKNVSLAELAVKELLQFDEREKNGALVQLSNIYLTERKSDEACRIRRMIGDRGLKKIQGCSIIEVDGVVNEFVSGDVSHPKLAQIHAVLGLLSDRF
ncbi:hypothetical protein ACFE04_009242 [Oxalis oulophora]